MLLSAARWSDTTRLSLCSVSKKLMTEGFIIFSTSRSSCAHRRMSSRPAIDLFVLSVITPTPKTSSPDPSPSQRIGHVTTARQRGNSRASSRARKCELPKYAASETKEIPDRIGSSRRKDQDSRWVYAEVPSSRIEKGGVSWALGRLDLERNHKNRANSSCSINLWFKP